MKLVLSRKGFDASYGGMASPILPDGRLIPLPIPSNHDRATFADLGYTGVDLDGLIHDLSRGRHGIHSTIHLDPDLDRPKSARPPGWRPALGQTGAAQNHLARSGVGSGDVFLFFGWFRQAEMIEGRWRYQPGAPDLHVLFGWLEVGDMIAVVTQRQQALERYPWCLDHPHVSNPLHYTNPENTLYIAKERSNLLSEGAIGGGRFPFFDRRLQLTQDGQSRSKWSLPECFMPRFIETALSYHRASHRWHLENGRALLSSVAKGQEFVLDCDLHPGVSDWAKAIVSEHSKY